MSDQLHDLLVSIYSERAQYDNLQMKHREDKTKITVTKNTPLSITEHNNIGGRNTLQDLRHPGILLGLMFYPEVGFYIFIRNVG